MTRRDYIPLKTQLAAALIQVGGIPHDDAKAMSADQILSLFQREHTPIPKENGGPDIHWNLHWTFIGAHRLKTATIDIPQIAKGKRIRRGNEHHAVVMAAKATGDLIREPRKHRIPAKKDAWPPKQSASPSHEEPK